MVGNNDMRKNDLSRFKSEPDMKSHEWRSAGTMPNGDVNLKDKVKAKWMDVYYM